MITPEQQAKQMYDEMYTNCTMTLAGAASIWPQLVKKQCLLVIQYIYDADYPGYPSQEEYDKWAEYWQQVKTEIEKL